MFLCARWVAEDRFNLAKTLRNHKDSPLILLKFDLTYFIAHTKGKYLGRRLTTLPALDANMCAPQEDKEITIVEQGKANEGYFMFQSICALPSNRLFVIITPRKKLWMRLVSNMIILVVEHNCPTTIRMNLNRCVFDRAIYKWTSIATFLIVTWLNSEFAVFTPPTRRGLRSHACKIHQHAFSVQVAPYLNKLPEEVVSTSSVEIFKTLLHARCQFLFPEVFP